MEFGQRFAEVVEEGLYLGGAVARGWCEGDRLAQRYSGISGQNLNEFAGAEMIGQGKLGQEGDALVMDSCTEHHFSEIGAEAAFGAEVALVAVRGLVCPVEGAAVLGEADQLVVFEIVGNGRGAFGFEIGGACHQQQRREAQRFHHHAGVVHRADADDDVEAFGDDIDHAVVEGDVEEDLWVGFGEAGECG